MLEVPGAKLFYRRVGQGPRLLVIQGGDGDADGSAALVDALAERYTVITYDPRGLSRSTLEAPPQAPWFETHLDDAHRLISALGPEPLVVLGSSRGALLGLGLLATHPSQVRLLIAHEPPAWQFLDEAPRAKMVAEQKEIEAVFQAHGVLAAMRRFAVAAGVDFSDREPGVEFPAASPARAKNLGFFLTYDAPAVHRYQVDESALRPWASRIVPGVGERSTMHGPYQCAVGLAKWLGVEPTRFPGGHSGFISHPRGFAARVHEVIAARS